MFSEPDGKKQRFTRHKFESDANLLLLDQHGHLVNRDCRIENINKKGMCLRLKLEGEINDLHGLPVDVRLPSQYSAEGNLQGEFVWEKSGDLAYILCGVKFNKELPSHFMAELYQEVTTIF